MASLEFDAVNKTYDTKTWAVRDLSFTAEDGEFLVLVGPSGCGKTTALRMLAGFEEVTAGEIRIGGRRVNEVSPRDRDIAMVFQNYALYPHMNVYDNIGYGLRVRGVPKAERKARIEHAASVLALTDELKRKPSQLSGGQRQRVAMGRAIVREPQAFLMDEPLSNLDARLRVRMRTEIAKLQRDLGVTTVYVTHDQVEAMTMADRVAVMRGGVLQQIDTPQSIYSNPVNLFVATFIGSPAMNILEGQLHQTDGDVECRVGSSAISIPNHVLDRQPLLRRAIGEPVMLGVRPDSVSLAAGDQVGLQGTVAICENLGSEMIAHVTVEAAPLVRHPAVAALTGRDAADATLATDAGTTTVIARLPGGTAIRRGDQVTVHFDADSIHFFDPDDGTSLRTKPAQQLVAA